MDRHGVQVAAQGSRNPKVMPKLKRSSELLIYSGIGIAVVGVIIVGATYFPEAEISTKWAGFAGMTAIVFGYTVANFRQYWRSQAFWSALVGLLIAHIVIGSIILKVVFTKLGTA